MSGEVFHSRTKARLAEHV